MYNRSRAFLLVGIGVGIGILLSSAWPELSSFAQGAGCRTFAQTGHKVCGKFLDYWNSHGGLAQQGYPVSEEFVETSALNGKPYTVQYFERAVFELHPENVGTEYEVLLSQLGTYLGTEKYTQGFPAAAGEVPFYEDRTEPERALLSYYNAVNRREYERAYGYFQGAPNPDPALAPPYAEFVRGYANTASVALAHGKPFIGAAAGSIYASLPVVITATQTGGNRQLFAGCYVLRRASEGVSPDPADELWRIYSAAITSAPANADIDALLARDCTP